MFIIDKGLTRKEFWKWITLLLISVFILGMVAGANEVEGEAWDTLATWVTLGSGFITIYLSARRCIDIGWHPAWGIFGYTIFGVIFFGIPKYSTKKRLRLEAIEAGLFDTVPKAIVKERDRQLHQLEIELARKQL